MSVSDSVSPGNDHADALDPTLDFLAGTIAGVSGLVVGFPFDTVKYRFQNPSSDVQYRSTLHALATITREERLRGLYKGIASPLATAPLLNGLLFATYRSLIKLQTRTQTQHDDNDDVRAQQDLGQPTLGQIFLAGAGCGLASTLLTTPIELIKIQQQKQQQHLHHHHHSTTRDVAGGQCTSPARAVAQHVYRTGGIRGFYRGLSATVLRDVGGYGLYFFGYEGTLRLFTAPADHAETLSRPWAPLLLAGGAAGILGWLGTFPFDVIKTRMQAQDIIGGVAGTSCWRAVRELSAEAAATGGGRMRVFWRGFVPTVVRAVPVNMAVFGTFEGIILAFS